MLLKGGMDLVFPRVWEWNRNPPGARPYLSRSSPEGPDIGETVGNGSGVRGATLHFYCGVGWDLGISLIIPGMHLGPSFMGLLCEVAQVVYCTTLGASFTWTPM